MFVELTQKLKHTGQLETTVNSGNGLFPDRSTVTSIVTVQCYCYQDDEDTVDQQPGAQLGLRKWHAILLSQYRNQAVVGAILKNVVDQFGNIVFLQGQARIDDVITYRHWDSSQEFIELLLRPNC